MTQARRGGKPSAQINTRSTVVREAEEISGCTQRCPACLGALFRLPFHSAGAQPSCRRTNAGRGLAARTTAHRAHIAWRLSPFFLPLCAGSIFKHKMHCGGRSVSWVCGRQTAVHTQGLLGQHRAPPTPAGATMPGAVGGSSPAPVTARGHLGLAGGLSLLSTPQDSLSPGLYCLSHPATVFK